MYNMSLNVMPSGGALLGTMSGKDVISSINAQLNASGYSYFGSERDLFRAQTSPFIQNIIIPIQQTALELKTTTVKLSRQDQIIPLSKPEDFSWVPPSMHWPIVLYQPIRELLEDGRVEGFGINPDWLPEENCYERILKSGTWTDEDFAEDGTFTIRFEWDADDPELTDDEKDAIRTTYSAIDEMLENSSKDPTNYPLSRG